MDTSATWDDAGLVLGPVNKQDLWNTEMKLLSTLLLSLFRGKPEPQVLDHVVPVKKGVAAKRIARARAEAAKRHGRPFLVDKQRLRETAKSPHLQEIEAATAGEAQQGNVSNLKRTSST